MQGHFGFSLEHQQSTSLASLLQRRTAQRLQHVVDIRGVPKPVEDEACRSPLDCFDLGNISFFRNVGGANL